MPSIVPTFDQERLRPLNDMCEGAFNVAIDGGPQPFSTFNGTQGMICRDTKVPGPGVWFGFAGNGERVSLGICDDTVDLDSGFNIFISNTGLCDDLTCTLGSRTRGGTCSTNEIGGSVTFRTRVDAVYFVNVFSFPPDPNFDFDIEDAGATGLLRVFSAA
jgi:hypothetical protein